MLPPCSVAELGQKLLTPADQEIISLVPLYKFVSAQSKLLDDVSPWFCPVTPRVELRRQDCKIRETGLICLVCETLPDRFDTSRVPESAVIQLTLPHADLRDGGQPHDVLHVRDFSKPLPRGARPGSAQAHEAADGAGSGTWARTRLAMGSKALCTPS